MKMHGQSVNRPFWARFGAVVLLFCGLVILGTWLFIMASCDRERGLALSQQAQINDNLIRTLQEHVEAMMNTVDQRVRYLKEMYERDPDHFSIQDLLERGVLINHFLTQIGIVDQHGILIMTNKSPFNRVDLRDREHFRVHVDQDSHQLFVSKPVLGRSSNKWSIQFTRRINLSDGKFGGIVVVSLDPFYFTGVYNDVAMGSTGSITLVGDDGVVRAQQQAGRALIGDDVSQENWFKGIVGKTHVDFMEQDTQGHAWQYSSRRLRDYPFYVVLRTSLNESLMDFESRRLRYFAAGGVITLAVSLFCVYILWLGRRLQISQAEAEAANRQKSEFLARVSHELRTPLNGVIGAAEYICDAAEESDIREAAQLIHQSGQRFGHIVGDMLELASIEAGKITLRYEVVSVVSLLDSLCDTYAIQAEKKGIILQRAYHAAGEAQLDTKRFAMVMAHLLGNAIKFTQIGSVTVSARRHAHLLSLEVEDTGCGIAEADLPNIFAKFQQVGNFSTRMQAGSGLGLALVRELVRMMGGHVSVVSQLGQGSRFAVHLPLTERQ